MTSREQLTEAVTTATATLNLAQAALDAFDELPENNVYATIEEAAAKTESILENLAFEDCEGAYNCGAPEYTRGFVVDGVTYIGTLTVEYNRHDKMYYYIEESEFTYKEAEAQAA